MGVLLLIATIAAVAWLTIDAVVDQWDDIEALILEGRPTIAGIVTALLLSFLVAFFFLKDGAAMWNWMLVRVGTVRPLTERVGARVWTARTGCCTRS